MRTLRPTTDSGRRISSLATRSTASALATLAVLLALGCSDSTGDDSVIQESVNQLIIGQMTADLFVPCDDDGDRVCDLQLVRPIQGGQIIAPVIDVRHVVNAGERIDFNCWLEVGDDWYSATRDSLFRDITVPNDRLLIANHISVAIEFQAHLEGTLYCELFGEHRHDVTSLTVFMTPPDEL